MTCLLGISIVILNCGKGANYSPRAGDIVFQVSESSQSRAIQLATGSNYTHMGLVVVKNGGYFVAEAVQPVKLTPVDTWIQRGKQGHYSAMRLSDESLVLSDNIDTKLLEVVQPLLHRDYDLLFAWTDDQVYCSELVWKVYKRALGIELAPLRSLGSFDLTHPQVRAKLEERYGDQIPSDVPVVAPSDIYKSPLLVEVFSNSFDE